MAGECLWGCACWVVVPYEQIRGPEVKTAIKPLSDKTAVAQ